MSDIIARLEAATEGMMGAGTNTLGFQGVPISKATSKHCWEKMIAAYEKENET